MQFWIHDVECLFVGHGKPCLEVFLIKFLDARRTLGLRVHVAKQLLRADVVAWGLQDMDEIPGNRSSSISSSMKMFAKGVAVTATYEVRELIMVSSRISPLIRVGASSGFDEFTDA